MDNSERVNIIYAGFWSRLEISTNYQLRSKRFWSAENHCDHIARGWTEHTAQGNRNQVQISQESIILAERALAPQIYSQR